MAHGRQSPETVSKKKTIFFANGEVFFLTYFLIGASGGRIKIRRKISGNFFYACTVFPLTVFLQTNIRSFCS